MADKIDTLQLKTDPSTKVYPNIKTENIPDKGVTSAKLADGISLTNPTVTGSMTLNGTLDVEKKATFGSDAEVDGKLIVNSIDSITDKDGNAIVKNESLDEFKTKFFSDYGFHRFSNVVISNYFEGEVTTPFDSQLTNINAMFTHAKVILITGGALSYLGLPDYPSVRFMDGTFDSMDCRGIHCGQIGGDKGIHALLAFFYCTAETIDIKEGKSVKINYANSMFLRCANLVEVGAFDMSLTNNLQEVFKDCPKLKHIHCTHFRVSFDISDSTAFEQSDLVEIISNLDAVTTPKTLTMGATNLAKLTQAQILVATGKGWTLA